MPRSTIYKYLKEDLILPERLPHMAKLALNDSGVFAWIISNPHSQEILDNIAGITCFNACIAIRNPAIRAFISDGLLTINELLLLTSAASQALGDPGVRALISDMELNMCQTLNLTPAASIALRNAGIRSLIAAQKLSIEQVIGLSDAASRTLCHGNVIDFIKETSDLQLIAQIVEITDPEQVEPICNTCACGSITDRNRAVEDVLSKEPISIMLLQPFFIRRN